MFSQYNSTNRTVGHPAWCVHVHVNSQNLSISDQERDEVKVELKEDTLSGTLVIFDL